MKLPGIICCEGLDGSGKTTQAKLLADYVDAKPINGSVNEGLIVAPPCLRLKFPDRTTPIGNVIDRWLTGDLSAREPCGPGENWVADAEDNALVLQSLMLTNRFERVDEILKAVNEGRTIVLDRFSLSALAYGMADGLKYEWLERIHTQLPKARTVFIDIPVEESFKRRPQRTDAYESDKDRLSKARANYLHVLERNGVDTSKWFLENVREEEPDRFHGMGWRSSPSAGYYLVNGLGTVDEVQARIRAALEI